MAVKMERESLVIIFKLMLLFLQIFFIFENTDAAFLMYTLTSLSQLPVYNM